MNIHKEGHLIIVICAVAIGIVATLMINFVHFLIIPVLILLTLLLAWVFWFFRDPVRIIPLPGDDMIYAPCDGKVVVIEKVIEPIYFKEERLLVSIFMSPLNVHVNRVPVAGIVRYNQYFPGKYLVAWHPKSSTENERNYSVIDQGSYQVGIVQIAGAMARRIINYLKTGESVKQGEELGFIRFGSRVDLYLPLTAQIEVKINDIVQGNLSCIARMEV
jgi:phosphatidylserine decarboxylase